MRLLRIVWMIFLEVSKRQNYHNHNISNCGFCIMDILLFLLWGVPFPCWYYWTDIFNHKRELGKAKKQRVALSYLEGYFCCIYGGYFKHKWGFGCSIYTRDVLESFFGGQFSEAQCSGWRPSNSAGLGKPFGLDLLRQLQLPLAVGTILNPT